MKKHGQSDKKGSPQEKDRMNKKLRGTIHVCKDLTAAQEAIRRLDAEGFPLDQVSLLTQHLESGGQVHGYIAAASETASDRREQWMGGLFGLLTGAAFMWLPDFGPLIVAGPLATALLRETDREWQAGGDLLAEALGNLGIGRETSRGYEAQLRNGRYVIVAQGPPAEVARARQVLQALPPTPDQFSRPASEV